MDVITAVSLAASISTLLGALVKTVQTIHSVQSKWKGAPRIFRLLDSEFSAVRSTLIVLEDILCTREEALENSIIPPSLIRDEILAIGDTVADLEAEIVKLLGYTEENCRETKSSDSEPGAIQRLEYLWNEADIREFLEHFRAHKSSLAIHMNSLCCEDSTIVRLDIQDLKVMIKQLARNQRKHEESATLISGSTISSRSDYTRFSFDQELLETEVYKRVNRRKQRVITRRASIEEIRGPDSLRAAAESSKSEEAFGKNQALLAVPGECCDSVIPKSGSDCPAALNSTSRPISEHPTPIHAPDKDIRNSMRLGPGDNHTDTPHLVERPPDASSDIEALLASIPPYQNKHTGHIRSNSASTVRPVIRRARSISDSLITKRYRRRPTISMSSNLSPPSRKIPTS